MKGSLKYCVKRMSHKLNEVVKNLKETQNGLKTKWFRQVKINLSILLSTLEVRFRKCLGC